MAPKKKRVPCHFPGDPRFGIPLSVMERDLESLRNNDMLSTNLLDFLIQQGAPSPASPRVTGISQPGSHHQCQQVYVGGLSTHFFITQANALCSKAERTADDRRKIANIQKALKGFSSATVTSGSTLIVPLIFRHHFFVLVIECCGLTSEFYKSIQCYDSLRHSARISRLRLGARNEISGFLTEFHRFTIDFILCDYKHQELPVVPPNNIDVHPCPCQQNTVDCGLFAVAIILHIIDGVEVNAATFDQTCITQLRTNLTNHLSGCASLKKYKLPSIVIRDCFSHLNPVHDSSSAVSVVHTTASMLFNEPTDNAHDAHSSDCEFEVVPNIASALKHETAEDDPNNTHQGHASESQDKVVFDTIVQMLTPSTPSTRRSGRLAKQKDKQDDEAISARSHAKLLTRRQLQPFLSPEIDVLAKTE
jgi:hypothetical protein